MTTLIQRPFFESFRVRSYQLAYLAHDTIPVSRIDQWLLARAVQTPCFDFFLDHMALMLAVQIMLRVFVSICFFDRTFASSRKRSILFSGGSQYVSMSIDEYHLTSLQAAFKVGTDMAFSILKPPRFSSSTKLTDVPPSYSCSSPLLSHHSC